MEKNKVEVDSMLLMKVVSALSLADGYIAGLPCSDNSTNRNNREYVSAMVDQTLEDLLRELNKEGNDDKVTTN